MANKTGGIWTRWWFWVLIVIAAALILVHALLPFWIRDYVNKKLSEIEGYRGHVQAVELNLFRGAYKIRNVNITKTSGDVPVPFFSAAVVDLSVEWKALFEGSFVGEIDFYHPKLNFVKGESQADTQVGVDKPWAQKIKELFPLRINRFVVHNGEVHYRDFTANPKVDLEVDKVDMIATNLTNSKKLSKSLIADVEMHGRLLGEGHILAKNSFDPYAKQPTFSTKVELSDIELTKLNDFAKAYGGFTFESGTLRLATELNARNGRFTGYVEPVFDQMSIFNPERDSENPISFIWQGILEGVTSIIRNHPKDRFGTKVPLAGSFEDPAPEVWETLVNVFRNAFVKAFEGKLDNDKVEIPNLEKEKGDDKSE
jgi:Domain of Unknown Function (DUF748)